MQALEISERTLHRAFEHLEKNNFITIEHRFDENGRQISNGIYINIPQEFIDNYEEMIQMEGAKNVVDNHPVKMTTLGASKCPPPPRQNDHPYNNNKTNNKLNNKREREKKKPCPPLSPFVPNEEATLLCKTKGLDLLFMTDKFLTMNKAKGLKHNDIDAAFKLFVMREYKPKEQKEKSALQETTHVNSSDYIERFRPCSACKAPLQYCTCNLASKETNLAGIKKIREMLSGVRKGA